MDNNSYQTVNIHESCQNGAITHTNMDSCISTNITIKTDKRIHEIKFIKSVCCIEESFASCLLCSIPFFACICINNACFLCASCVSKTPLTRHLIVLDNGNVIKK